MITIIIKRHILKHHNKRYNEDEKKGIEQIEFKKDIPYIMDLTFK